jgi:outer membrane protein OmpA-like peptidoglycan-associated protein
MLMNLRRLLIPVLSSFACVLSARAASAQTTAQGFALDRFEPSERGSDWFAAESLDLRGQLRFGGGLVFDYSRDPLVLYRPDGSKLSGVVSDQFFAHVGAALVVADRVRFALNLPLALVQSGTAGNAGSLRISSDNSTTIGDLRLGADLRIAGQYGDPATFALGVQFFAPTGSQASFTSDGSVRLIPRALLAGDIDVFTYSLGLGYLYRANDKSFAGDPRGSEMNLTAAAGLRLADRRLVLGPELYGSTIVSNTDSFFAKHQTPFEVIFGGHLAVSPEWRVGLGVGPGLTRALGTPALRGLLSIEWQQSATEAPPPPRDRDHDGIVDPQDACPDVPGVRTDDPKTIGCPPPPDRDKDGVLDEADACPDDPGEASADPKLSGCPDRDHDEIVDRDDACPAVPGIKTDDPKTNGCPDRDKDGILDDADACPDEAGEKNADPKKNGCPPSKDRDADGIPNEQDACPDSPGKPSPDPKKNGCPVARVEKGQIRIVEQVQFALNSAQILKASDFILEAVAKILTDNPQIKSVRVEGHTDNKGSDALNKKLSQKRADSVVAWLVKHGIDKNRLSAVGYGKERPIDTNDTNEGRANNRRVEFHIEGQEPAPSPE